MLSPNTFLDGLKRAGIGYFAGVPDSLLKGLCACIAEQESAASHTICANEGGAVGMAIGYHLATGKIPAVYMQNSGLGNAVNPLLSLADGEVYSVPMLLIIGWRGQPGVKDEPQHVKQGRVMVEMLRAMEIPAITLGGDPASLPGTLARVQEHFATRSDPLALIVPKNCFEDYELASAPSAYSLTREAALAQVLSGLQATDLVVSTTGMLSRELFELREIRQEGHGRDFMLVGGMGHTSAVALGVALARPTARVICLDGDGSALMHMGALAIAGQSGAGNLKHVVFNNGAHDSVGGQPTVAIDVELCDVARAVGYVSIARADAAAALGDALPAFLAADGPAFLEIRIRTGARADLGRPTTSPADNKRAFMQSVGS
ncbi:MAG: phosphonopyruvate decarboxylase [Pseudomonadales bacterium]